NGFDLANGLPTSYKEYFIYKISPLEKQFKGIISFLYDLKIPSSLKNDKIFYKDYQYGKDLILPNDMNDIDKPVLYNEIKAMFGDLEISKLSFWDFYFWYLVRIEDKNSDLSWFNVEAIIKDFVFDKSSSHGVNIHNLENYIRNGTVNLRAFKLSPSKSNISIKYLDDMLFSFKFEARLFILFDEILKTKRNTSKLSFYIGSNIGSIQIPRVELYTRIQHACKSWVVTTSNFASERVDVTSITNITLINVQELIRLLELDYQTVYPLVF
ncbi:MAG: restriction endonuclease, partial [Candidatus Cloacimonetes bacterium]|nr:restriction endonuclease [Candidatus Cloacimonadota bacterium]